ncbi:MAG: dienelactone hydrolase family protein [Hyphomonadaceae bacterium]
MCDEHTEASNQEFFRAGGMSRRSAIGAGAATLALANLATVEAEAQTTKLPVVEMEFDVDTPDGKADVHFAVPAFGKHPAVLVWPDIMGLRPAFKGMGRRLAEAGYAVLTINPFYRLARGQVFDAETEKFSDAPVRQRLVGLMQPTVSDPENTRKDAIAMFAWLDKHGSVDTKKKAGTTGYCMGGPLVMRTAGYVPNRIGCGATFHGGGLLTGAPTSPHLLIPQMKATNMLHCVAQNDDAQDATVKDKLRDEYAKTQIKAEIEVYPAQHGWCPTDSQVYDETQAEKAWTRLLANFKAGLK